MRKGEGWNLSELAFDVVLPELQASFGLCFALQPGFQVADSPYSACTHRV